MRHPFQCIVQGRDATDGPNNGFVVAACGPRLLSWSLTSNELVAEWPTQGKDTAPATQNPPKNGNIADDGPRAAKKQRTDAGPHPAPSPHPPAEPANVLKLIASPNSRFLVAVTDDKCIRVFEAPQGRITEINQRWMPKRPCAIQVLPDNATILCGDKFGDVYSLPLIPPTSDDGALPTQEATEPPSERNYKPAASLLTVHSERNRKTLEFQMSQKNFTPKKEALKFEHRLLLGHVSMLTDMKYVSRQVEGIQRGYIITADRDEHIRISRGPPQAHIIEGFCLGHTQFISKICPIGDGELLVSGGGDDWLGVWNWLEGKLWKKFYIRDVVKMCAGGSAQKEDFKLAVSGIWNTKMKAGDGSEEAMVIACEKVKALFIIAQSALEASLEEEAPLGKDPPTTVVELPGSPLDVVANGNELLVSLDVRGAEDERRLGVLRLSKDVSGDPSGPVHATTWDTSPIDQQLDKLNAYAAQGLDVTEKELDELLYNVATLRKRGQQESPDGGTEAD